MRTRLDNVDPWQAGVTLMPGTFACDPLVEGNAVRGVFVESKSGRQAVLCKVLIDATGEADMVRRAGAAVIGRSFPTTTTTTTRPTASIRCAYLRAPGYSSVTETVT